MPKGKIEVMKGGRRAMATVSRKFKVGGRKSTKSALSMNDEDLRKVLRGRPRDAQKARNELTRRGAPLVLPVVEEVEAEAA